MWHKTPEYGAIDVVRGDIFYRETRARLVDPAENERAAFALP